MPVTAVVTLFSIVQTFADFQIVFVLTRGGPVNSTHLFATLTYDVAIRGMQLGEGAATGDVKVLGGTGSRFVGEKRLPGGAEETVPTEFQQPVDDYFRALDTP